MGIKSDNATMISSASQRVSALRKHLASRDEVFVDGKSFKASVLIAIFQNTIDTRGEVVTTRGKYKAALAARATSESQRLAVDDALKSYVLNRFGADSAEAHDFGYSARKVGEKSAATKAHAVELSLATRDARGTVGKKKKLKIKGTLPSAATSTSTSTSSSTTSAAPAATVVTTVSPTATTTTAHS